METVRQSPGMDVVCAGHICLDITPQIPDVGYQTIAEIFRPGRLINVESATVCPGGPVANVGLALARLGLKTSFMTKVGRDLFGRIIIEYLRNAGAVEGITAVSGQHSSYSVVIAPPGIDRLFLHHPGTNDIFTSEDIDFKVVKQAKIFHFGYPPVMQAMIENGADELVKTFRLAKQSGITTSLDMSLPDPNTRSGQINWLHILERVLPYVDIFLPSIEEASFCLEFDYFKSLSATASGPDFVNAIPTQKYSEYANQLLEMGCKFVMLKAAQRGIYLRTTNESQLYGVGLTLVIDLHNWASREIWCPPFQIHQIANATGAGDAAIAGFLSSLIHNLRIERAIKTAACVGFQSLHQPDAFSGVKNWHDTQMMLESGQLTMNDLSLENEGWYWEKSQELWLGPNDKMIIN